MTRRTLLIQSLAAVAAAFTFTSVGAISPAAPIYALRGARVFTAAGAPIENGTVVLRNGVIDDVGAGVTVPPDAIVIDATGMNVYPGLIDMANEAPIDTGEAAGSAVAPGGGGGGRGGGGGGGQTFATLEEAERVKRTTLLRPDFRAADNLRTSSPALAQLASAGITTVLAVPSGGIFKGQSALVNVAIPADDPQIGNLADYRKGLAVVKSPVAMHINMAGRGGGQGYPNSLLGSIAFTRQGLLDAQWQRDAVAQYTRTGGRGQRPVVEPALDALQPALANQMSTAWDAGEAREIDRVLAMAAEFSLASPIVVGAAGAADRTAELQKAKARVILSANFPTGRGGGAGAPGGGGGGRGGGGGGPSLAQLKAQANAPKVPAALAQAGVPFALSSGGSAPADFVRNVARAVKDGGLAADAALRALTIDAARLAGAADRIGSIEKGKIANLVVTQGDLLSGGTVRHVFIDGRPVDLEAAGAPAGGRGGRGGQ